MRQIHHVCQLCLQVKALSTVSCRSDCRPKCGYANVCIEFRLTIAPNTVSSVDLGLVLFIQKLLLLLLNGLNYTQQVSTKRPNWRLDKMWLSGADGVSFVLC